MKYIRKGFIILGVSCFYLRQLESVGIEGFRSDVSVQPG